MVVKTLDQFEKNVSASFGYVKKDILMVNDAISDLHDKIQHLSLNQAGLMGKLDEISNKLDGKNKAKKAKPKKAKITRTVKTVKIKTMNQKKNKKKSTKSPKQIVTETVLYE